MAFLGGAVPPPVFEVSCTDGGFVPRTANVKAGQSVRYKCAGTLNHIVAVGDHSSPLLRPGQNWILSATILEVGSHEVQCEVTCMKGNLTIMPQEEKGRANKDAQPTSDMVEEFVEPDDDDDDEDQMVYDDPRIDGLVAQLKAAKGPPPGPAGDESASDDEDAAEFMMQRQRVGHGGTVVS